MKKIVLIAFVVSISMLGCKTFEDRSITPASADVLQSEMQKTIFATSTGIQLPVRMYVPAYSPMLQAFPLIVYLHGAGQNGDDNKSQLDSSVGCIYSLVSSGRDEYKALQLLFHSVRLVYIGEMM